MLRRVKKFIMWNIVQPRETPGSRSLPGNSREYSESVVRKPFPSTHPRVPALHGGGPVIQSDSPRGAQRKGCMAKARQDRHGKNPAQGRLQMADIARLAGVSTATVSRALNNSPLVNEETRGRILELASSLKYSINIGAQNLRLKQNRTISVQIPVDRNTHQNLTDPFLLAMLGSLADALTERGFDMLFSRIGTDEIGGAAAPYDSGRVVGIIMVGQWGRHQELRRRSGPRLPDEVGTSPCGRRPLPQGHRRRHQAHHAVPRALSE